MIEATRFSDRIPEKCLEWFVSARLRFLSELLQAGPTRYFSAHLPVMATWGNTREGNEFPVNLTVKGLGLVPKDGLVADYTDIFERVIAEARAFPWEKSLPARVDAASGLYGSRGNFDRTMLGGLEIFGGKALENLRENPSVSLLYVGMACDFNGMNYMSFQVNGKVRILEKDDPYYRFLLSARKLFEYDKFHIFQPDYPYGYLVKVAEVRDKTPWSMPSTGPAGASGYREENL